MSDEQIKRECKACSYYEPLPTKSAVGECRFNPPTVSGKNRVFPKVAFNDWCREFYPKPEPQKESKFIITCEKCKAKIEFNPEEVDANEHGLATVYCLEPDCGYPNTWDKSCWENEQQ